MRPSPRPRRKLWRMNRKTMWWKALLRSNRAKGERRGRLRARGIRMSLSNDQTGTILGTRSSRDNDRCVKQQTATLWFNAHHHRTPSEKAPRGRARRGRRAATGGAGGSSSVLSMLDMISWSLASKSGSGELESPCMQSAKALFNAFCCSLQATD